MNNPSNRTDDILRYQNKKLAKLFQAINSSKEPRSDVRGMELEYIASLLGKITNWFDHPLGKKPLPRNCLISKREMKACNLLWKKYKP